MPERALAEKFGVSRGTVRNARQKLKSQAGENPVSETVETDARESQWCSSMPISARPICSGLRS
jgi:transposase-like protein